MTLHKAWMQQAESDLRTAHRIDNELDPRTRCQAISKYQQSVEKALKAVLDKLHASGLVANGSDRRHYVARYAIALARFPTSASNRDLLKQMQRLFSDSVVRQIELLDSLVPEYPAAGLLARRNHEYPFQSALTIWHAPSEKDVFSGGEMKRIRNCAGSLIPNLRRIVDSLDLLYPP